jgi:endoribonuclease Dicer
MVEDENNFHRHALARTSFDAVMHRWADAIQHDSSWPVPPRPLRESYDAYISDSEDDQDSDLVQDPVTGHHLHKHQASATLYRYASRLANLSGDHPFFTYTSSENAGLKEWRCTIKLAGTHIDNFSGPSCPSRYLARRETSYAACRQLQHLEELDSSIFSRRNNTNERFIPGDEDEVQIDTGHERPHVPLSTDFWTNSMTRPPFPDVLYPRILSTADPGSGLDERAPMCILTRAPLPEFSQFRLFHLREPVEIRVNRSAPVKLDLTRLEQAHRFTVKFCRIIMNKPFESPSWQSMGYLFLPMKRNWRPPPEMDQRSSHLVLADGVDWNMVSRVSENWAAPVDPVHLERELEDAVIQDRAVEFTHRCEVTRIRNDISPLTEVDDKPKGYSMLKYAAFAADERFAQGGKTLLEQCHSRRKTFEGLKDPNQPILEVKRMPGATNCLNPRIPPNKEVPEKVVQREP